MRARRFGKYENFIPAVACQRSLSDVCQALLTEQHTALRERLNAHDLWEAVERHESRQTNSGILLHLYRSIITNLQKKRGRMSMETAARLQQSKRSSRNCKARKTLRPNYWSVSR